MKKIIYYILIIVNVSDLYSINNDTLNTKANFHFYGFKGSISNSYFLNNSETSGSIGLTYQYFRNKVSFESCLFFSVRNLLINENYPYVLPDFGNQYSYNNYSLRYNYVEFPFKLKYSLLKKKNIIKTFVYTGVSFGYLVSGKSWSDSPYLTNFNYSFIQSKSLPEKNFFTPFYDISFYLGGELLIQLKNRSFSVGIDYQHGINKLGYAYTGGGTFGAHVEKINNNRNYKAFNLSLTYFFKKIENEKKS